MFATLRAGSLLYILNKGEEPSLKVGQVLSVTPPRPKVNTQFMPNPMQLEQVIDITVKVGDDTKAVAFTTNNYVISDDKQAITNEIEAFGTLSQNALNSVPYHKRVVSACKQMMLELNPSMQKEADRDAKIGNLEKELAEMRNGFAELTSLLKGALKPQQNASQQRKE